MGKLIELLNEFEQLNMCRKFDCFEGHTFENSSGVDRLLEDTVISRRYGFIEWLVENDKIDLKKLYEKEIESGWDFDGPKTNSEDLSIEFANQYNTEIALMLLSISSSPIEDLISYLR